MREAFDRQWRERVARGEDPLKALSTKVEDTPPSSFIEIWWRKARGKEKTRAEERDAKKRREGERVERGSAALLSGEGEGEGDEDGVEGEGGEGEEKKGKSKLHDRLRWGI